MELFHPKVKKSRKEILSSIASSSTSIGKGEKTASEEEEAIDTICEKEDEFSFATSFSELGVCEWLQDSCTALGMRQPTPVQV